MDGRHGYPSELVAQYSPAPTSDDCDLSTYRSPGGSRGVSADLSEGGRPGVFYDDGDDNSGSPQAMEDGCSRAVMLSPPSATRSTEVAPTQQFPQYYRDEAKRPPARETMMSGISGLTGSSGLTGASGLTAGPGTPMLPAGIPKSAFDEDTPKPKQKLILCGIKKSNFFILLVLLIFILVTGVAIGVGVGMLSTSGASPYAKQTNTTRARYHSRIQRLDER